MIKMHIPDPEALNLLGSEGRDPNEHYFGPSLRGRLPTPIGTAQGGQGAAGGTAATPSINAPTAPVPTVRIPDRYLANIMSVIRELAEAGDFRSMLGLAQLTSELELDGLGGDGGEGYFPSVWGAGGGGDVMDAVMGALGSRGGGIGLVSEDSWTRALNRIQDSNDRMRRSNVLYGGGQGEGGADAGTDAGHDAGTDAGHDAGVDGGHDAGTDTGAPDTGVGASYPLGTDGNRVVIVGPGYWDWQVQNSDGYRISSEDLTDEEQDELHERLLSRGSGGGSATDPKKKEPGSPDAGPQGSAALAWAMMPAYLRAQEQRRHRTRRSFGPGGFETTDWGRPTGRGAAAASVVDFRPSFVDAPVRVPGATANVAAGVARILAGVGPGARPPAGVSGAAVQAIAQALTARGLLR